MKLAALVVVWSAAAAAAPRVDERPVRLVGAVKQATPDGLKAGPRGCTWPDMFVATERVFAGARVELLYECPSADAASVMVLQIGNTVYWASSEQIEYHALDMTAAPLVLTTTSDRLTAGKLDDGTPVVVRTLTQRRREIDERRDRVEMDRTTALFQVCTLTAPVACQRAAADPEIPCAPGGCPAPSVKGDELLAPDRDGTVHAFKLERGPAPPPPP